jgi:hypothetical protein
MAFKGIRKVLFVTGLACGFGTSLFSFADMTLDCRAPSTKLLKEEKKEINFEGKKKEKELFTFVASQVCKIKGVKKTDLEKLPYAYEDTLRSYKKHFQGDAKKGVESFNIKSEKDSSFRFVHTRPTPHGVLSIEASMSAMKSGDDAFTTNYESSVLPKVVDSYSDDNNAKYTYQVIERSDLRLSTCGAKVTFTRTVTIVKPKGVPQFLFKGPAENGIKDDFSSFVDFHKTVYNKAF